MKRTAIKATAVIIAVMTLNITSVLTSGVAGVVTSALALAILIVYGVNLQLKHNE